MNSLVKFTKQYKASLIIAIAIIMFILFGFCSAVDVVVLDGSTNLKLTGKMSRIPASFFFGISIVLCLIFAYVLPSGLKLAWASWLYMLAGVIGIAVCNIEKLTNS